MFPLCISTGKRLQILQCKYSREDSFYLIERVICLKFWKEPQHLEGIVNLWSPFKQTLLNFRYSFSLFITAKDIELSLKNCLLETWLRVHYYYYCKPNVTLSLPIFTLMRYKSLLWIILKFPNAFLGWTGPHILQPEIWDDVHYCLPRSGKSLLFHKYLKVLICGCSWWG